MDIAKIFDKSIVIVLLVLSFVILGAVRIEERNEKTIASHAEEYTREFGNIVRVKGYVDPRDYEVFLEKLDLTGGVFLVVMEHYKKRYEPLYGNSTDFYSFTGSYEVVFEGFYTEDILKRMYHNVNLPDNDYSRRYNMKAGDLFAVRISAKELGIESNIRSVGIKTSSVPYSFDDGGMVRNEAP